MPWVLDGNNLARGGDRGSVRAAALRLARSQRIRIVLYFDGAPPPGVPDAERLGRVEVRYVADADAAIAAMLTGGGKGWRLATDDAALGRKAKGSGAEVVSAASFWARVEQTDEGTDEPAQVDVAEEIAYFEEGRDLDADRPRLVPRRRRKRRK